MIFFYLFPANGMKIGFIYKAFAKNDQKNNCCKGTIICLYNLIENNTCKYDGYKS